MEEINEQLNQVLAGNLKANDAHADVQTWLRLSVYNIAHEVAAHSTRDGRNNALELVKNHRPEFYDDVTQCAKHIFTTRG